MVIHHFTSLKLCRLSALLLLVLMGAAQGSPGGSPPASGAAPVDSSTNVPTQAVFPQFTEWVYRYVAAGVSNKKLEAQGKELALRRRQELARIIDADPKHALELALPLSLRLALPTTITILLEERVSGHGDFLVLSMDSIDPKTGRLFSRTDRMVSIKGRTYRASVYGRRAGLTTKRDIPIHGIALNGVLAVDESPLRLLEPPEVVRMKQRSGTGPPVDTHCPVCGLEAGDGIWTDAGGKILVFDNPMHLTRYEKDLEAGEQIIGPDVHHE